jgi:uncharacterized membrane protein YbhN (UPF0104 family)
MDGPAPDEAHRSDAGKKRVKRIVQGLISLVIVVAIFFFAIPKIADYGAVWRSLTAMTWFELTTLALAMVFNLVTYWWQVMAAMPGLGFFQAAVVNQTATSVADTLPGGGYVAVGVTYTIFRSWGFRNSAIALFVLVTGIWNLFLKLGLPVLALAVLAIQGQASGGLVAGALIGMAVLVGGVVLFALVLWKTTFARRIGNALGTVVSFPLKLLRRPPVEDLGEAAVRYRRRIIDLVAGRYLQLTLSTVVSHLTLFLVLLVALRHVGISEREISTAQVLGVFAFGRLVTALPLTPGGLGLVELSYIGALILAGRDHADVAPEVFRAQVAAAVLVFRALTYAVQVPIGGVTYLIWRAKKDWRKPVPTASEDEPAPQVVV